MEGQKIIYRMLLVLTMIPSLLIAQKIIDEDLLLNNGTIELPGTLSYPDSPTQLPLAVFIHGSGNVDRNGNQSGVGIKANYIKILADSLNQKGIAFYRYDKRTATSHNLDKIASVTLHSFADDAKIAIDHLKNDSRFGPIYLIGHSQGSLVAMLSITPEISGYISIAGPGQTVDKVILEQLSNQNADLAKVAGEHIQELKTTDTIERVHPFLMQLFQPRNQKFFKSWMLLDPVEELKKIDIPILLLQGEEDLQVTNKDFQKLMEANPNANGAIVPQMNHVLKDVYSVAENQNSYFNENFPLSRALVEKIVEFINPKK
ncbi:alpha/beta hydrolase [Sediminicola sp. 1XM1-17]|uniref:alpha/beta hydrolase n=1 Tax=Sediminicola sp. 1XM1-17 TaxID=3127702 RepID=UPI003076DF1E